MSPKIDAEFQQGIDENLFSAAVYLVARGDEILHRRPYGHLWMEPGYPPADGRNRGSQTRIDSIFDVASLTKPLVTVTLVMLAIQDSLLRLEDRVGDLLPIFLGSDKEDILVEQLLSHCSGLKEWHPFYQEVEQAGLMGNTGAVDFVRQRLLVTPLQYPPGSKTLYSDLGYLLLQWILEKALGSGSIDSFFSQQVANPLGLKNMFYIKLFDRRSPFSQVISTASIGLAAMDVKIGSFFPAEVIERIAATEICSWRGRMLRGQVHDRNCFAMNGIGGHAGLFASIDSIYTLLRHLADCYQGKKGIIRPEVIKQFWRRRHLTLDSSWTLGYDTPSEQGSTLGDTYFRQAVGHLAFTGCSMWYDRQDDITIILLANRVYPFDLKQRQEKYKQFRRQLHHLTGQCLENTTVTGP